MSENDLNTDSSLKELQLFKVFEHAFPSLFKLFPNSDHPHFPPLLSPTLITPVPPVPHSLSCQLSFACECVFSNNLPFLAFHLLPLQNKKTAAAAVAVAAAKYARMPSNRCCTNKQTNKQETHWAIQVKAVSTHGRLCFSVRLW